MYWGVSIHSSLIQKRACHSTALSPCSLVTRQRLPPLLIKTKLSTLGRCLLIAVISKSRGPVNRPAACCWLFVFVCLLLFFSVGSRGRELASHYLRLSHLCVHFFLAFYFCSGKLCQCVFLLSTFDNRTHFKHLPGNKKKITKDENIEDKQFSRKTAKREFVYLVCFA